MSRQTESSKFQLSWGAISFIEAPSSKLLGFAIFSIIATLLSVFAAAFYVNINVSILADGETDSILGVTEAVSPHAGELYRLPIQEGDQVKKDQVIGWIRMGDSSFDQVASVYKDLKNRLASISEPSSTEPTIKVSLISDVETQNMLTEVNRKFAELKYIQGTWLKNTQAEAEPLKRHLAEINKQLRFISNSKVEKYLLMQRSQLEQEKGQIVQQIRTLENTIETKTHDARSDAENALRNSFSKVQEYLVNHEVKSPVAGKIATILTNEGSFIKAGESIASIIPEGGEMIAKVLISSKDITLVSQGNKVFISIDAYPAHKFGYFDGEVISVDTVKAKSQNDSSKPDGYIARIRIDTQSLSRKLASVDPEVASKKIHLVPGMKVEARVLVKRAPIATLIIDKIFGKEL